MKLRGGLGHESVRLSLLFLVIAAVLLLLSLPAESQAKIINVPADQPTIQAAIDAAANGDTVQVAPGTYHENINFDGKAITVTSTAGPQTTIIDGGQNGPVVTFDSAEGPESVINGFTLRNGYGTFAAGYDGGGIYVSGASPTITGNVISGNSACANGAGIALLSSSAVVRGNTITNNSQRGCTGGSGGGIYIYGSGSALIIGNTISLNTWTAGDGGGIALYSGSPTIQNNLIAGNTAEGKYPDSYGGGIVIYGGTNANVVQNVIVGNNATEGGGIWTQGSAEILTNNTIVGNTATDGSAIYVFASQSTVQVANNILVGSVGVPVISCAPGGGSSVPTFAANDVFSPGGTAYGGACADQTGTNGNISADPLFFDPSSNNYHLQYGSPVVDKGTNSAPGLPSTDFDGNPRIYNSTVDMGAYEFFPATMSLSATRFTFGPTVFGASSPSQTLTITNTGSTKLLLDLSLTGDFTETNNCGGIVAAGGNCGVSLTFVPTARGNSTGTLVLVSNTAGSPTSISLTGAGIAPLLSLSSTSLNFGNQLQGTTSDAQPVIITNMGDIPLTFTGIATSGDFGQSNTCSGSIAVGSSCTISVTFTPTTVGQAIGSLTLTDNAPGTPQMVGLNGTGFIYSVPQISLPLGPDSAAPGGSSFTLTVNGSGFAPVSVINWKGSALTTTFVSATQLTAVIPASDISSAGTAFITVVNPSPGGGTSNEVAFQIASPAPGPAFSRTDISVGQQPEFIVEADFNGDGKPDLAVTNAGSNTVSILLGKGDGTFQPRVDYATGREPGAIAVGDFNKDGKLDLAVANVSCPINGGTCSLGSISILLGNGDGTFQPQKTLSVNYVPQSIAVGDFNGDGVLDLAVGQNEPTGGVITIFLGNGDGTFKPGIDYPAGPMHSGAPPSLVTGDFNGDGKLDLASSSGYGGSEISILLGNGDGTFKSPVQYSTGSQPQTIVAGDFNGDGKLDLAAADNAPGANAVSVLLGNGNGIFQSQVEYGAGVDPYGVTAADVLGDDKLDLVTANLAANTISILKGNGDGTFQANLDFPVGVSPRSVVAADFNGDGRVDLATANFGSNSVSILLQVPSTTATVSSNSLGFGNQNAGTTSSTQAVTITNTGNAQLYIDAINMAGDFAQTNTCGNPVAPGASCTISVTFAPLALGSRTGTLSIFDNASGSPQIVSLNGSGTGIGFNQITGALSHISVGSDGTVWGTNSAGEIWMFNPQTQNWQRASGSLTQIAVGANGFVWGLNSTGDVYRYDPGAQNWDNIPGNLFSIAVGCDGDVWGISSTQQILHFNAQTQSLVQVQGSLTQIAVGYDGAVWGLDAQGQVWRFNPGTQSFQKVPGTLTHIAVGADGDVWGINSASQIYHFDSLTQNWDNVPGSLSYIAVGSGNNVWGINSTGQVWRYDAAIQSWDEIPGDLAQIAVGANGAVWGINAAQQIFQFVQPAQPVQTFHQLPGLLAQVAVGVDGNVWGINSTQQIWHFNPLTQNWDSIPGALTRIAVGFAGNVWGINANQQVFHFDVNSQNWDPIPGFLSQIAVGANGDVWGINSTSQIYRFNPSVQNWEQIPGFLAQLSVGADGTVWGVNGAGQIYRFDPQTQNWDQVPGSLSQITVGSAGNVWGINSDGAIWRYDAQAGTWDAIPGNLAHIAVAFDGTVWGTNAANQIYWFDAQTQNWVQIPGSLAQIAVGADATVWGLNANNQIFLFR